MSYDLVIAGQTRSVTVNVNDCLCIFVIIMIKEASKNSHKYRLDTIHIYMRYGCTRACIPDATSAILDKLITS